MTGGMSVQSSSPIGFETLYAGYRWDSAAPQMYCVRNRFLLSMIGTWNRRDPLGYLDGMSLCDYCYSNSLVILDPSGLHGISIAAPPSAPTGPVRSTPQIAMRGRTSPMGPARGGAARGGAAGTGASSGNQGGVSRGPQMFYGHPSSHGVSMIPYYQEDDPYGAAIWNRFTPGGVRGPAYNPRLPSRYNNFGNYPSLQGEMSISAAPGHEPCRTFTAPEPALQPVQLPLQLALNPGSGNRRRQSCLDHPFMRFWDNCRGRYNSAQEALFRGFGSGCFAIDDERDGEGVNPRSIRIDLSENIQCPRTGLPNRGADATSCQSGYGKHWNIFCPVPGQNVRPRKSGSVLCCVCCDDLDGVAKPGWGCTHQ